MQVPAGNVRMRRQCCRISSSEELPREDGVDHRVEPPAWLPQGAAPEAADPEADQSPAVEDTQTATATTTRWPRARPTAARSPRTGQRAATTRPATANRQARRKRATARRPATCPRPG